MVRGNDILFLVPVKAFDRGKSRLAGRLDLSGRKELSRWMLGRVLDALEGASTLKGGLVVSQDPEARSLARGRGIDVLAETSPDLNGALLEGVNRLRERGAAGVLVLPADLPLLSATEVDNVVAAGALFGPERPGAVASPSRREEGTNALFLKPSDALVPSFGPDSFLRHRLEARQRETAFKIFCSPGISLDIDLPQDLDVLVDRLETSLHTLSSAPR